MAVTLSGRAVTVPADAARGNIMVDPAQTAMSTIQADMGMILARSARRFGSRPALVADGRTFTYAELDDLCGRLAGALHDMGIRPGDRVSLYSPNRWEWVVAYH